MHIIEEAKFIKQTIISQLSRTGRACINIQDSLELWMYGRFVDLVQVI